MTRRPSPPTRACLLITAISTCSLPLRAQSPWSQPEGAAFYQLSLTRIGPYDELFRDSGPSFRTGREITETSLELYGEYGLADGWTVVGNLPVRSMDTGSVVSNASVQPVTIESDTLTALGNVVLGVRKQLASGEYAVAAQLDVELPTGTDRRASGLSTGLDAFTFRPTISIGRGFERSYAQAYAGFGLRTDGYANDWRLGAEAGYRVSERFLLAGTLELVSSFEDGDVTLDPERLETGLFVDEQEYVSVGLKGLYDLDGGFGVSGAVRGAFSGHDVPESAFMTVGVFLRR